MKQYKVIAGVCMSMAGMLDAGAVVPENTFDAAELPRLIKEGFIEEVASEVEEKPKGKK